MKIVVNAASAKMGGAVSYVTNLLLNLSTLGRGTQFVVFMPPETIAKLGILLPNIRPLPTRIGHASLLRRVWWEQFTLRVFLKRERADVLFSTANFAMFRCPVRQLLLIRNAVYFSKIYRETFLLKHSWGYQVTFALRRWLICQSAKSADMVMTPTQSMLDELRKYVDVPPGKAMVNAYGVAPDGSERSACPSTDGIAHRVRLLYISLYGENKNLTTLLKALPLLNKDVSRKCVLITTANPAWEVAGRTMTWKGDAELAQRQDILPWVKFVGPLGQEEINEKYRTADIFVFPSVTESFGHPMVEAMSHGLPIVASDTPVNREICGESALYFHPWDPEDLARKIQSLFTDQSLRMKCSEIGRLRAATHFRWQDHADRLLSAANASVW